VDFKTRDQMGGGKEIEDNLEKKNHFHRGEKKGGSLN